MKTKNIAIMCLLLTLFGSGFATVCRASLEDAVTLNNDGVDLYQRGFYAASIDRFKAALTYDPANTQIYTNMGYSYMASNMPEYALDSFRKALSIDPSDLEARYNLGVLLAQQQNQQQQKQGNSNQQQDQKDQKKQDSQQQHQSDPQKQEKQDAQQQQSGQQNPQPAPKPDGKKPEDNKEQQASKPEEKKDDKDKQAAAASEGKPGEKPPEKQIQGAIPREQAERLLDLLKEEERRGVFLAQPQPAVPEQDLEKDW